MSKKNLLRLDEHFYEIYVEPRFDDRALKAVRQLVRKTSKITGLDFPDLVNEALIYYCQKKILENPNDRR